MPLAFSFLARVGRISPRARQRRAALLATFVLVLTSSPLSAEALRARIFIGLPVNETQAARLHENATSIRQSLARRGIPPAEITLHAHAPGAPLRREHILAALAPAPAAAASDETWIIFLGTAAPDRSGQAAFQVSGPRLGAAELASALAALPGKKFVALLTASSGAFLPPLLALPDIEAVAATAESGQLSEPRFTAFWAEAFAATPSAPFAALAASAADRVDTYYAENSFAQSETARLLDRATGRILAPPFSEALAAPAAASPASSAPALAVDLAKIHIPRPTPGSPEVEERPADADSLALLAAARSAALAHLEHSALLLRTETEVTVARDHSSRESGRVRAYLRGGEALDHFGTIQLPHSPPHLASQIVSARVIRPDGTQLLLNPAARSARLAAENDGDPAESAPGRLPPFVIELPEVAPDSVVEFEWVTERRSDSAFPAFYQEWPLSRPYPQLSLRFVLAAPRGDAWTLRPHRPEGFTIVDDAYHFDLADLPAHEPLPHDLPARATQPWIGLSSLATWDEFAAWYRRLAEGSEAAGPAVEALAAEIAAAHAERPARLRAAYERVAALRYVTVPLGVAAFRPRTPEQVWVQRYGDCKDKANLLVAVLARLGIQAEFALVNRFDATFTDFPGWQFNHALARIPAAPEAGQPRDLWLDATDRLVPFGVVAPGNLGRHALVFSPGFARAAFHQISAAQEEPATWTETFSPAPDGRHRIVVSATGSAELALRRLLLGRSPAQRRALLADWLGSPIAALEYPDPFDLSRPFTLAFTSALAPDPELRPLAPGLAHYLQASDRARTWDEGRAWTYLRSTPTRTVERLIPAQLP